MALTALGLAGVWQGNRAFAPEMYSEAGSHAIARAFAQHRNVGVFDLNINIREIKDAHIRQMEQAPDAAVLGASHWQEAHAGLVPYSYFYNAHIHRDYWEDMLGVVEMFVRHDKLPKRMLISIRDNLFTPVADRNDHLWLPGAPYARAMALRLGLVPLTTWETLPVARWREQISVSMLYGNAARWYNAAEKPNATRWRHFDGLDTLLPDGSILWSGQHQRLFTKERTERLSASFADQNLERPPPIERRGVQAIDRLLGFLKSKGVDVVLTHPPFNPQYFERVKRGSYYPGLKRIEAVTRELADKHDLKIVGGFDPAAIGCTADQYIDAEHANAQCLRAIFDAFVALDPAFAPRQAESLASAPPPAENTVTANSVPAVEARPGEVLMSAQPSGAARGVVPIPVVPVRPIVEGAARPQKATKAKATAPLQPAVKKLLKQAGR